MSVDDEHQRVRRIKEYVLARLREELGQAPRGAQAQLAKELGVSEAHLSNMLSRRPTRQPGEDFRRKVAVHWGITYAQLEAVALGEDGPPSSLTTIAPPRDHLSPNLAAALSDYAWMPELPDSLRDVVVEQAVIHRRLASDFPVGEWQRIVTGLEREALALLARRTLSPPASGVHDGATGEDDGKGKDADPRRRGAR